MLKTVAAFDRIGEENAFAVLARATQLAAQGRDIVNLGIGQPDFRTPDHIVEAAVKALRDGHHGYTAANGTPNTNDDVDGSGSVNATDTSLVAKAVALKDKLTIGNRGSLGLH